MTEQQYNTVFNEWQTILKDLSDEDALHYALVYFNEHQYSIEQTVTGAMNIIGVLDSLGRGEGKSVKFERVKRNKVHVTVDFTDNSFKMEFENEGYDIN